MFALYSDNYLYLITAWIEQIDTIKEVYVTFPETSHRVCSRYRIIFIPGYEAFEIKYKLEGYLIHQRIESYIIKQQNSTDVMMRLPYHSSKEYIYIL